MTEVIEEEEGGSVVSERVQVSVFIYLEIFVL